MTDKRLWIRSTLLYLAMLVLVGAGFEGIRRIGRTLTPPRHIAGEWYFALPASPSSCPLLEFPEGESERLQVEQSGRFLVLSFADVHHTRLRARFDGGEVHGSGVSMIPCAKNSLLYVTGHLANNQLQITLRRSQETPLPADPTLSLLAMRPSG